MQSIRSYFHRILSQKWMLRDQLPNELIMDNWSRLKYLRLIYRMLAKGGISSAILCHLSGSLSCRICCPAQLLGQPDCQKGGKKASRNLGGFLVSGPFQCYCSDHCATSGRVAGGVSGKGALCDSCAMVLAFNFRADHGGHRLSASFSGCTAQIPDQRPACWTA